MKRISLSYWIIMLALAALFSSCSPEKFNDSPTSAAPEDTQFSANVIYGTDGRLDVYQVTDDRLKAWADSTVALIKNTDLAASGNLVTIKGQNFGTAWNLCSTEKFREQDSAAFCSGTLVGPDLVLTAGHCIMNASDCSSTSFVFGFAVKSQGLLPKTAPVSEVYHCSEIVHTQKIDDGADFALVRLDRSVANHAPRAFRASGEVDSNASLIVIGHPVGLPTKITTGGSVRSTASSGFFVANLDTYGGNSGSGVFNLETGLIEGVLVRGEQDFVQKGSCMVSNVCAEGQCRGEDVTRISSVKPFMPEIVDPPTQPPVDPPVVVNPPVDPPSTPSKFTSSAKISIPDNNKLGIVSSLDVSAQPNGRKVIVTLNITHTYIGDLSVVLTAPDGKKVTLQQRAGGSAHNLNKTYEVTSSLGNVSVTGAYKLSVKDLAAQDSGSLDSWSIEFR